MRTLIRFWLFLLPLCSVLFGIDNGLSVSRLCKEDEESLLLQLKNSLRFEANVSVKLVTWNDSLDCCSWGGVTCDSSGHVVQLDLSNELISGALNSSSSLFNLQHLQSLNFSNNSFNSSQIPPEFRKLVNLMYLNLSSAGFSGQIPIEISNLTRLVTIDFSSSSYLVGTRGLKLENPNLRMLVQNLRELRELHLNGVNISAGGEEWCQALSSSVPKLQVLKLASCKLKTLPDLRSQSRLIHLDLSENQIRGKMPNWIWNIGNGSLLHLNLSHNLLEDLEKPSPDLVNSLSVLDLHSNLFHGQIPIPPSFSIYVDYSDNRFDSSIPRDIGNYISFTIFFSLSKNDITGNIPMSICNARYLQVLDFSDNALTGEIPSCLIENKELVVLNLRRNNFSGTIPAKFPVNCSLQTLDLNGNHLGGEVPKSLANCKDLEVLNLGYNGLNDVFPCSLKNTSSLRVLVLRANNFHGPIGCPKSNYTWAMLQIVDLAYNNFSGKLPSKCFSTWTAMMAGENEVQSKLKHLQFRILQFSQLYYQDAVTVTSKGLETELVKVLTIFTSIDLSCNNFQGEIPELIGNFTSLYALNLSHNGFTGQIPSSIGNMRQLESLDLSRNRLSGEIPAQLANLTFLSVLDLSSNLLEGRNPAGCGLTLNASCGYDTPPTPDIGRQSGSNRKEIKWEHIASEIGFVTGLGMVIWPL